VELVDPRVASFGRESLAGPDAFWESAAAKLPWRRRWDSVFEWDPGRPDARGRCFRWFQGGVANLAWTSVDRHLERGQTSAASRRE
jgi:hypothetical protein